MMRRYIFSTILTAMRKNTHYYEKIFSPRYELILTKVRKYSCNDEIIHLFHVTQSTMNTTTAAINHSKQNEKDTNHSIPPK